MPDLRHLLSVYVHAHATGNSVPPHLDSMARAALAAPTPPDWQELCQELLDVAETLHKQSVTQPHCGAIDLSNGRHIIPIGSDILAQDGIAALTLNRARAALAAQPTPTPPADGEAEELAEWLEALGDDYDDLYRQPSAIIRPQLTRAAALLRESRPQPGWQPISTAPTDGTEVLASDHYAAIEIVSWSWDAWETGSGWIDRDGRRPYPAWWQPLPEDPPIPTPTEPTTETP